MIRLGEAAPALQTLRRCMCGSENHADDLPVSASHEHFAKLAGGTASERMEGAAAPKAA